MRVSTLDRARRSCSSASALKRATNTPYLIGIEMFISAGDTVGLPTRLMTGFASSPSSKPLRPAGFSASAQDSSARASSFSTMAVSEYRGRRRSEVRGADSRQTIKNERFSDPPLRIDDVIPQCVIIANSARHWVTSIMMHRQNDIGENSARRGFRAYVWSLKCNIRGLATV
jgi:hypothetical protein